MNRRTMKSMMKKVLAAAMAAALCLTAFVACGGSGAKTNEAKGTLAQFEEPVKGQQIATIKVKDYGEIKAMLFPKGAPKAVENFVTHAKEGYYDGVKFHRVIADFMAQTGDPEGTGMGGESIWGEGFEEEYDENLRNFTGALAMARTSAPSSLGSQFYIVNTPASEISDDMLDIMPQWIKQSYGLDVAFPDNVKAKYKEVGGQPTLDGFYTVFGQVYEGLDIISQIMQQETDPDTNMPKTDIIIESITISEYEG